MTDPEFTKYLIGQGGFALAFVVLFWFYRKDVKSYTELWKAQTDQLMTVVKENTVSNTQLVTSNNSMQVLLAQVMRVVGERVQPQRHTDRQAIKDDPGMGGGGA